MSTTSRSPEPEESEEEREPDVWDDDGEGDLIALFVLDEVPVAASLTSTLKAKLASAPIQCSQLFEKRRKK